jgi:TldD protein
MAVLIPGQYQDQIADLLDRYRRQVDYIAIRLETVEGSDVLLRGHKIETLSEGISLGGQVRVCHRGGWGFASFNRLESLRERLEEAMAAAKLIGDEETVLAAIDPIVAQCQIPIIGGDPREILLGQKKALCEHYGQVLRDASEEITTISVRYGDSTQRTLLHPDRAVLVGFGTPGVGDSPQW